MCSSSSFEPVGVYMKVPSSSSGGHMMMPSSSVGGDRKYDVFLSFRGEDTRKTFVGHLYGALQQNIINAFIDSEDLDKGKRISELLIAIEDSRISIVVLSQNYASSKWCLKELAKIMDCTVNKEHIVVPIFYDVDPSDVRNINGTFSQALAEHEENSELVKEEVESWRSALTRFADLSGWDSRDYKDDAKLIKEVVESTFRKLTQTSSKKANGGLVGMDFHIAQMYSRLCLEVNDVRIVGIWGMGGLGKTTIAKAVYDEIACQFEHSCFVHNVKEAFTNKREVEVQREILSQLLNKEVSSGGLNRSWNMIKGRLGRKRVLVVLDDVGTSTQIEELLGELHEFGEGSRIIVTTRDKQSLKKVDDTYLPKCLGLNESRELFMKHAFRTDQSIEDYNDLLNQAIKYAQGLPLALQVLGGSLYDKQIHEWKDLLEKIKIIPEWKIMDVLRISLEGLGFLEQQIFLDIACLFRGWRQDDVKEILHGLHPHIGLKNLINRALVTISEYGTLDMHDLLQELGRQIVRREPLKGLLKEPGQHSRLWSYEDVDQVLTQNTAKDVVECLVLRLPKDYCLNIGAFVRMTKLRVLIINGDGWGPCVEGYKQVTRGELGFLSHELRLLEWKGCPLESLPSTFIPKNLVRLDLRYSHIQKLWEGTMPLQNLKEIRLSYCESLVKIPDLTEAIHLKKLYLFGCSSLRELHSSIFDLQELEYLDSAGCKQLEILPSSIRMKSLKTLNLLGCSNLVVFPEISEVMSKLTRVNLNGTAIKELPESINNLTGLGDLVLSNCTQLTSLSSSIHLSSLRTLNLKGCSNLENFPEISGIMKELSQLLLDGTAIKRLPSSIDLLQGLKYLTMNNCKSLEFLPDSIRHLVKLTHLRLYGCIQLKTLSSLPDTLWNLAELRYLDLSGCTQLRTLSGSIRMSSLEYLNLHGCSNLENFPEISGTMKKLSQLCLDGTAVKGLPSSIHLLEGLKTLTMRNCKFLECLPDSICNLAQLTHLDLSGCSVLHYLPEQLGDLQSLTRLEVLETGIKHFPLSVLRLYNQLDTFSFDGCRDMVEIRKSVTEWGAESTETTAERGTYQILVLLPEPQIEIKEEEVMVAEAKVDGTLVLGSVCCCLSLSGCSCIMSLSNRNRKRRRQV